jgi:hypothetical protein
VEKSKEHSCGLYELLWVPFEALLVKKRKWNTDLDHWSVFQIIFFCVKKNFFDFFGIPTSGSDR